jgi:hypothetical protein
MAEQRLYALYQSGAELTSHAAVNSRAECERSLLVDARTGTTRL